MMVCMSNVIRPTFGAPREAASEPAVTPASPEARYEPLRVYGTAAGYLVALLRDDAAPEGPVVKVVVGPDGGNSVEAVAILPATPEGEADADMAAMAVLRALEVLAGVGGETLG